MIVFKYWCEPATQHDRELLDDQLRFAADYRRELAEIENRARFLLRALKDAPELRAVVNREHKVAALAARDRTGANWGTYQNVEEAADHSAKTTRFYDDLRTWFAHAEGCVAVHLQPARALRGADDRWIIVGDTLVRHGSELRKNGQPRPARHIAIDLRVGTNDDRSPRFARVHVRLHRPLPPDAIISWVRVKCRRIATKRRWEIQFTLSSESAQRIVRSIDTAKAVGVDIGWRKLDDKRIRVAYWVGSDGAEGELIIPEACYGRDTKSDSLRQIRDRHRDTTRAMLCAYREAAPNEAWHDETQHLHAWKKQRRFIRLLHWWRDHRHAGDQAAFSALEAWANQDRHLWEWEANNRQRRQAYERDAMTKFAVMLARRYDRIGIEAPFIARTREKDARCAACESLPKRCDECRAKERLRSLGARRGQMLAPASVRDCIERAARRYDSLAIRIEPAYTTLDCPECGYRRSEIIDQAQIELACAACALVEDQDRSAARNLLRHASEAVLDEDGRPLASEVIKVYIRKARKRGTRKRVINGALETVHATK